MEARSLRGIVVRTSWLLVAHFVITNTAFLKISVTTCLIFSDIHSHIGHTPHTILYG